MMNQITKNLLFGLFCFAIGGFAIYTWSTTRQLKQQNATLLAQQERISPTPLSQPTIFVTATTAAVSPQPAATAPQAQTGKIAGTLGYPSEGIPPMTIYAFKQGDLGTYFLVKTQQNQSSFTIDGVAPGNYVVVAFLAPPSTYSGGYTKAVPCGLSVECTDHSLIPVEVIAGQTTGNVDVKDWYAAEGTFPSRPN